MWLCINLNPSCRFHKLSPATEGVELQYSCKQSWVMWRLNCEIVSMFFILIFCQVEDGEWGRKMPVQPNYRLINTESRLVSHLYCCSATANQSNVIKWNNAQGVFGKNKNWSIKSFMFEVRLISYFKVVFSGIHFLFFQHSSDCVLWIGPLVR